MLSLETVADRTAEALGRGLTPKSVLARVPPEGQGQSNLVSIMAVDHDARFAAQLAAAVSAKGSPADERDPAREIPS